MSSHRRNAALLAVFLLAVALCPLLAAPKQIELDPVAQTPPAGKPPAAYHTLRIGQNSNCHLRGASASAYVKENAAQFPGRWGWMPQCRVGGSDGDRNRTLLYFDLADLPRDAHVQQATLVCSLVRETARQASGHRYGAYLVKLPDAPGWDAAEVTLAERKAGATWPGGIAACTGKLPAAVGEVIQKRIHLHGRERNVPVEIRFDLTGAVRAWRAGKVPNCGVLLDNRLGGGAYDIYSARSLRPELRPYLEIDSSHAPKAAPKPVEARLSAPAGDDWVAPMRRVHARFKGTPGTLAQYGDSITVTMAFLAGYSWSGKIEAKNMTPEVRRDADTVQNYANLKLWREWKGGQWGNTGMMMSNWLHKNIDAWQRKMNPEAAVIMFGTNDIGRLWPPAYTENMAASLRRMMADGTVPILTSIPPANRRGHREYWLAALAIARALEVPLIDYYAEVRRRRPDDWNGRLDKFAAYRKNVYEAPTLVAADGTHPSNPKPWRGDFSDDALNHNGFVLRNYMTVRTYAEVIRKVLKAK